jgi:hypothetical protein
MTGTKVLLILLIVIVVLFVVFVAWGALRKDPLPLDPDSFPVLGKMADHFGSPSPELKPTELTPNPPPLRRAQPGINVAAGKFILRAGDQPTTFDISPDSHNKFRRATFSVTSKRCVEIRYTGNSIEGDGGDLRDQSWPGNLKSKTKDDLWLDAKNPTKVTFQILSGKGQLIITSQQPGCVLQLETQADNRP